MYKKEQQMEFINIPFTATEQSRFQGQEWKRAANPTPTWGGRAFAAEARE
jgi:hypothetical protein